MNPKKKAAVGLVILAIFCFVDGASLPLASEANTESKRFFFPYLYCVLLTIKKVRIGDDIARPSVPWLEMTVHVDDVLSGPIRKGDTLVLTMQPFDSYTMPKPYDKLPGKKCVLAFSSLMGNYDDHAFIYKVYAPFPDQKFSAKDVNELRSKLNQSSLPYYNCLMVTAKSAKTERERYGEKCIIDARVDDVLLGDLKKQYEKTYGKPFKNGTVLKFTTNWISPDLLPLNTKRIAGSKCIWVFHQYDLKEKECVLYKPGAPFPNQTFSDNDLRLLKARLAPISRQQTELQESLQNYLPRVWSVKRIKEFCRPELRVPSDDSGIKRTLD